MHFGGKLSAQAGTLPSDSDIEGYFQEVENALIARRIRAVKSVREQALRVLKRFNALEGPTLYPRIIDTECRLQSDRGNYILHGNVDVLVNVEPTAGGGVEIWDYKGAIKPSLNEPDYERYVFQMQVYADLYRIKTGTTPNKAVLYFLNELAPGPTPTQRPINALIEVDLDPTQVKLALQSFADTVQEIEKYKAIRQWPDPAKPPAPGTCTACDLRWNCNAAAKLGRHYPLRHP